MPKEAKEVKSAEKATEVAVSFIGKYHPYTRPIKAIRQGDVWFVEVDVGALRTTIATIKVDAKTATVLEYEIPPS